MPTEMMNFVQLQVGKKKNEEAAGGADKKWIAIPELCRPRMPAACGGKIFYSHSVRHSIDVTDLVLVLHKP